ncbi:hypothetical protein ACWEQG_35320 [Microbispora sp. NPDC004025]
MVIGDDRLEQVAAPTAHGSTPCAAAHPERAGTRREYVETLGAYRNR